MLKEIERRKSEIQTLCRRFGVRRLDLFGSAALDGGTPQMGDLDFLVDLGDLPPKEYAEAYFGLREALERPFTRPVDPVTAPGIRNPFFKQRLEQTRSMLYAA
ncbi:MAG: nucleotidyltransferase domain-containing protein [Betaproteobacteria bacterium]|nr:nucleotidyltransferase domain-containing protein [Betaproteobacteria bacterium]